MSQDPAAPLFYPFLSGALDWPKATDRALVLGAPGDLRLPAEFKADVALVQGFRPDFLRLQRAGLNVAPEAKGDAYDMALVFAGRHRGDNELRLADAITRVKPGGLIAMAGGKTDGISSLRKRLGKNPNMLVADKGEGRVVIEAPGGTISDKAERLYHPGATKVPLGGHLAKNHGEVFWLDRTSEAADDAARIIDWYDRWPLIDNRFRTAPGMFSHDRVDVGSRLLATHLPDNLKGKAADFCAGWGFLSVSLADRSPAISAIDLFEADHASLQAAGRNMAALASATPVGLKWVDLAAEPVERAYDVVVMNPPFHQGRAAEPGIGLAMIRAASNALKAGGLLFMVANRGLPYEPALKAGFGRVEELADADGFRVWKARR